MKKVLTVQDLSCLGKCSLTIALPVLSAMGCSTSVLPTAVLSTHTAFRDPHIRSLTEDMRPIVDHWRSIGAEFDGILVGYLSGPAQISVVEYLWDRMEGLRILDPAMGDNGKLYSGISSGQVVALAQLCAKTDLLLPNVTEACLLTGISYREDLTESDYRLLIEILQRKGCKQVVLTGVSLESGKTGFMTSDGNLYQTEALPGHYHGTGDLFAAVCTGALMQGKSLYAAARQAAGFVEQTIRATGTPTPFGIAFEPLLASLSDH